MTLCISTETITTLIWNPEIAAETTVTLNVATETTVTLVWDPGTTIETTITLV